MSRFAQRSVAIFVCLLLGLTMVPSAMSGRGSVVATPPYDGALAFFQCGRGACEGSADANKTTGMLTTSGRSFPGSDEPINIALGFARFTHTHDVPTQNKFLRVTADIQVDIDTYAVAPAGAAFTFVELYMEARSTAPGCDVCEDFRFKRTAVSVVEDCTEDATMGQCTWTEPASVHERRSFSMILQDWNDPHGIPAGPVETIIQVRGMSFVEPDSLANEAGFNATVQVLSLTVEPATTRKVSPRTDTEFVYSPPFQGAASMDFCNCPPVASANKTTGRFSADWDVPNEWSPTHGDSVMAFRESHYYELAAMEYEVVFHVDIDRARAWVDDLEFGAAYVVINFTVEHFGCRGKNSEGVLSYCVRTLSYVLVEDGSGYPHQVSTAPIEVGQTNLTMPVRLSHPNGAVISPDEFRAGITIMVYAETNPASPAVREILGGDGASALVEGGFASYNVTIFPAPWPEAEFDRRVHF